MLFHNHKEERQKSYREYERERRIRILSRVMFVSLFVSTFLWLALLRVQVEPDAPRASFYLLEAARWFIAGGGVLSCTSLLVFLVGIVVWLVRTWPQYRRDLASINRKKSMTGAQWCQQLRAEVEREYQRFRSKIEPELPEAEFRSLLDRHFQDGMGIRECIAAQFHIETILESIVTRQHVRGDYIEARHIIGHVLTHEFVEKYIELFLPVGKSGKCTLESFGAITMAIYQLKEHWKHRRDLPTVQPAASAPSVPVNDIERHIAELQEQCEEEVNVVLEELQEMGAEPNLIKADVAEIRARFSRKIAELEAQLQETHA